MLTTIRRLGGLYWKQIEELCQDELRSRTNVDIHDRWKVLNKGYESGWRDERRAMPVRVKQMVKAIITGNYEHWPAAAGAQGAAEAEPIEEADF